MVQPQDAEMLHRLSPPEEGQASSCAQILHLHPTICVILPTVVLIWQKYFCESPSLFSPQPKPFLFPRAVVLKMN